ncbi:hypothetical protein SBDP1_1110003 [Syntrophobacter sp. SbD1]|nr:hypothetical protein SBDP1_1110003 [Syntrophobacter sp. SbD1]
MQGAGSNEGKSKKAKVKQQNTGRESWVVFNRNLVPLKIQSKYNGQGEQIHWRRSEQ